MHLAHARTALDTQRSRLQKLKEMRGGIILKKGVSAINFCTRLASLLQEIAREKIEALRLLLFVDHFEKTLRAEKRAALSTSKHISLGRAEMQEARQAPAPARPKNASVIDLFILFALKR